MYEDRVFEFREFILAPKERLLLRGGEPVPLTPKAFDVLVVLVSRSGHLVRRMSCCAMYGPTHSSRR